MSNSSANDKIVVCEVEQGEEDWPFKPGKTTLVNVIDWLQAQLAAVPPEYRDTAQCEITPNRGYCDGDRDTVCIEVFYAISKDSI